ncbi:lysophospholipid acyltransferase family protein [Zavarzinia sp. CC-PAN008]|uniref:lysophospholipid acyltransferase family protein n=1 Tax=Zavarzinia sp. CC-PAN008 TaxID=3243332 RepID=UPI003F744DDE
MADAPAGLDQEVTPLRLSQRLLVRIAALYIRLVWATSRWTTIRGEVPAGLVAQGQPFLVAFWHGRMLLMPPAWWPHGHVRFNMLISQHKDGELIARTMHRVGIGTVRGSTSKGGDTALRAMIKALRRGEVVGITPDGPRGPRMRASEGVVSLARLAGVPVVPTTFSATRSKRLGSWDRFVVAWPFQRGIHVWGEPITVPRDLTPEQAEAKRQEIEDAINAVCAEADRLCGMDPVAPAPPAVAPPP